MMIRFRYLIALVAFMMVPAMLPAHAQDASRLQDRMSASDFYNAGLNKLSAQELAALNQWLATHQGNSSTVAPAVAAAAAEAPAAPIAAEPARRSFFGLHKRDKIEAHLVGQFTGWNGNNVITLDNGQQWQQVGDDHPMCTSADNPAVTVKPSLFGNWLMNVPTCNQLVHVKRIR